MTDPNLTHIFVVLDRSGSMKMIESATVAGFNDFLAKQKAAAGAATMSIVQFSTSDDYRLTLDKPIADIPPLTSDNYNPDGARTALWDAVARSIDELGFRLASMPEERRPGRVIFFIITDGQNNVEGKNTDLSVKQRTAIQTEKYNWQFLYLGANQDAVKVGGAMGIDPALCASYSVQNIATAFSATSDNLLRSRSSKVFAKGSLSYSAEQRMSLTSEPPKA